MLLNVTKITPEPGQTVWTGRGTNEEGKHVLFAGDWRPMNALLDVLREEGSAEAWVEPWQVLTVLPANPEAN